MKLLSLYASNFKKLSFDLPVEFKEGLTLISGLNEAGKSSILDAILYGLFGRVTRPPGRARNEDIIAYNMNDATVIVDFEIEGHRYRVTRQIYRTRPSKSRLEEVVSNNQLIPLAVEVRAVTEQIEKLLGGITFDETVSSNVVAQKQLNRLVELRTDERKKVINVFLNLDSFNLVLGELNEKRKELEGTGIARPGIINTEKNKLNALREELEESKRRIGEIEKLESLNQKNSETLLNLEQEYDRLKRLQEELSGYAEALRKKEDLQKELEYSEKELKNYEDQITGIENQIRNFSRKLENYAELAKIEASLNQMNPKIDSIHEIDTKIADSSRREKELLLEISSLKSEIGNFDPQLLQKLRQSRRRITPFAVGAAGAFVAASVLFAVHFFIPAIAFVILGLVPLALLAIAISNVSKLATMERLASRFELFQSKDKDLKTVNAQLGLLESEKRAIENEIFATCAEIERYASMTKVTTSQGSIELAKAMMERAQDERREVNKLSDNFQALQNELSQLKERFDVPSHLQRVKQLRGQLESVAIPSLPPSIEFSSELVKKVSQDKESAGNKISGIRVEIEKNINRIDEDKKYIEEHPNIEEKVRAQEQKIADIEHEIKILNISIEAIEKTAEALGNRVKPGVEKYMGRVLPVITSGRYKAVRLDQDYNLQVWDPEAGEFISKDAFSGGTEDQLLLAMRLSFAQALLPEVYGRKPEFVFLDEPLGSSDEIRRAGILEFLKTGLRESFKQIFLISHVSGLEEEIQNIIKLQDGKIVSS